jgi:hypothetical protein
VAFVRAVAVFVDVGVAYGSARFEDIDDVAYTRHVHI